MRKFRTLAAALTASAVAVNAAALDFTGTYRQTANADCGLVGISGGAVKIANDIFYGVEVECNMTSPVDVNDMDGVLYTLHCSGEDQYWSERAMILKSASGEGDIIMIWNGYAFVYERCDAPVEPVTVPTASMRPQARP